MNISDERNESGKRPMCSTDSSACTFSGDTRVSVNSTLHESPISKMLIPNSTYMLIAKRNSGKSVMAKHVMLDLLRQRLVDMVVVFSGSVEFNRDWDCVIESNRIEGYDEGKLRQLVEHQREEARKAIKDPSYVPKRLLIIFDDVIGQDNANASKDLMNYLLAAGRHIFTTMVIVVQYPKVVLTPTMRNNLDFILISKNNSTVTGLIFEIVNSFCGSRKEFADFVEKNTNDHAFVVFNNSKNAKELGAWTTTKVSKEEFEIQTAFRLRPATGKGK